MCAKFLGIFEYDPNKSKVGVKHIYSQKSDILDPKNWWSKRRL